MRILLTGATGLIGSSFLKRYEEKHEWVCTSRKTKPNTKSIQWIQWDAISQIFPWQKVGSVDVVIHLLGEGVADKRWSSERKALIVDSRVGATENLLEELAEVQPPKYWLGASAIGYYGANPTERCDEKTPAGNDFLGQTCLAWENAHHKAAAFGTKVNCMRIGLVLAAQGGLLGRLLPIFKFGIGGKIGSGKQFMSWIHIDDLLQLMMTCVEQQMEGPVNAVAPNPVTNTDFTKTLGQCIKRPTIFPVPAFALKLAYGEMSEIMTGGAYVTSKLPKTCFEQQTLEDALKDLIGA